MRNPVKKSIIKFQQGFTLAEILLTLIITGILAAITIPALLEITQEAEFKTSWKNTYSILDQATKQVIIDNGGTLAGFSNATGLKNRYLPYVISLGNCDAGQAFDNSTGNCWTVNGHMKQSNGSSPQYFSIPGSYSGINLNNGASVIIDNQSSVCNNTDYGIPICAWMYVDVNGFKGPNTIGRDVFGIWLQKDGIKPMGSGDTYATMGSDCKSSGWACSTYYLIH